jgi:hypothetical protein
MADRVRTAALAEFDSAFPEAVEVSESAPDSYRFEEGWLQVLTSAVSRVAFPVSGYAADYPFDSVEMRLKISGNSSQTLPIQVTWQSQDGESGGVTVEAEVDNRFHTYRIYFQKFPSLGKGLNSVNLEIPEQSPEPGLVLAIDWIRLRDFPNPGGGFINSGIFEMGKHSDEWAEAARLIDRWRLVAGQGYNGNLARIWKSLARIFRNQEILLETDHPTWQWLNERSYY